MPNFAALYDSAREALDRADRRVGCSTEQNAELDFEEGARERLNASQGVRDENYDAASEDLADLDVDPDFDDEGGES